MPPRGEAEPTATAIAEIGAHMLGALDLFDELERWASNHIVPTHGADDSEIGYADAAHDVLVLLGLNGSAT